MIAPNRASNFPLPLILKFPTVPPIADGLPFGEGERITLRSWYERLILPDIQDSLAPRSLNEDRVALNRWEEATGNPDIREVDKTTLETLRDHLDGRGCSPATINKYWRELVGIFRDAKEEGIIPKVPSISRRQKSGLVTAKTVKIQRPTITMEEANRLYDACKFATYPHGGEHPAPRLWRAALVLFYTYGARTLDILQTLEWKNILWSDRLIKFQAMKTSKVQGLPMTEAVIDQLRRIRGRSYRCFPGFKTTGHQDNETGKWKRGFYTTLRTEIVPRAGVDITFKHFRQSVVTRYNGIEPGLGSWIAGHFVPGVSAQNYDLPTERIRKAIEAAPVPKSFYRED